MNIKNINIKKLVIKLVVFILFIVSQKIILINLLYIFEKNHDVIKSSIFLKNVRIIYINILNLLYKRSINIFLMRESNNKQNKYKFLFFKKAWRNDENIFLIFYANKR